MSEKVVLEEELSTNLLYAAAKCIYNHISASELKTSLFISDLLSYFTLNVAIDASDDKDPYHNFLDIEIIKKFLILLKNETDFEKKAVKFIKALREVNMSFSVQPIETYFYYKNANNNEHAKIRNELEKLIEKIESRYSSSEIEIALFEFKSYLNDKGFSDLSFTFLPHKVGLLKSLSEFLVKLSKLYQSNSVNLDDLNFLVSQLKSQNPYVEQELLSDLINQVTKK